MRRVIKLTILRVFTLVLNIYMYNLKFCTTFEAIDSLTIHLRLLGQTDYQLISWGFLYHNIWGAKQGRRQDFGSGGEHRTKFHT